MENFLEQMAELLEVDSVNEVDTLKDFDAWDSLTQLSIIALGNEGYGVKITGNELQQTNTVEDLWDLIQNKKK